MQPCQRGGTSTWSVIPEDSMSSCLPPTHLWALSHSWGTMIVIDYIQCWVSLRYWELLPLSPCHPLPLPRPVRDAMEQVPIIDSSGGKWALISAGDLVVVGCQHAFFHIGLLQGLMGDCCPVASHFRFYLNLFLQSTELSLLASIQTHCNSSESLSPSDGSIYEKFS